MRSSKSENKLVPYEISYEIIFFDENLKSEIITENDYLVIVKALKSEKFIEINGTLYNVSTIKVIHRREVKNYYGKVGDKICWTREEYERYLGMI